MKYFDGIAGRSPHGERGLKSVARVGRHHQRWSLPARGAWIEIAPSSGFSANGKVAPRAGRADRNIMADVTPLVAGGYHLRGGAPSPRHTALAGTASLPVRGAWIEMARSRRLASAWGVAPRMGGVDRNLGSTIRMEAATPSLPHRGVDRNTAASGILIPATVALHTGRGSKQRHHRCSARAALSLPVRSVDRNWVKAERLLYCALLRTAPSLRIRAPVVVRGPGCLCPACAVFHPAPLCRWKRWPAWGPQAVKSPSPCHPVGRRSPAPCARRPPLPLPYACAALPRSPTGIGAPHTVAQAHARPRTSIVPLPACALLPAMQKKAPRAPTGAHGACLFDMSLGPQPTMILPSGRMA